MLRFLTFVLLLSAGQLFGQAAFPASWEGEWHGTLEIFTATGKVQELPMELHILPIDSTSHSFTIIYGEDKEAGKRPYRLLTLDAAKGLYAIDEGNSIKMEAYLLNGKLIQWFEVEGTLLFTTTELVGDALHWEITSGRSTPASTTGGQSVDGEAIPPVKAYPVGAVQRAVMMRRR